MTKIESIIHCAKKGLSSKLGFGRCAVLRHTPDNILNFEWLAALPISGPNFFVFCRGVARLCALVVPLVCY